MRRRAAGGRRARGGDPMDTGTVSSAECDTSLMCDEHMSTVLYGFKKE